ncbi:MAG: DNA-3-methyladenine glycosylase I [Alphaproteobacteria bacterium]|jgi:DNA-3-methyladenine glycosylase I|nr:DNA-3-methyladenine glycosylase I [Rhodospirillaceae bacterium]MDP6403927.1 DNA-3-methyladenine glycosylase I [Alphaproteobacteria bacterium]MDP6622719.1 DNA-3-methyladenine glycosylase I [Alphaproteobacteria bacterium]|tara:strand:+ start:764 stop:1339 length:576 start_codon:yes stop_codon:yes gene_type:complete
MAADTETGRCSWPGTDALYVAYHDEEWGVPERDDRALFEKLLLDGFQAGLSWLTILRKRDNFRRAFAGFEPAKMARFGPKKIESLMQDKGIVRNRLKVESAVRSAQAYLQIRETGQSFEDFIWQFTDGRTITNQFREMADIPTETAESRAMSKALKAAGFNFCGPTICYAFMQATGIVNDHVVDCFRHDQV